MDAPYFIRLVNDESIVFDSASGGAIAQDGNEAHVAYLAWTEENGAPPIVPESEPSE